MDLVMGQVSPGESGCEGGHLRADTGKGRKNLKHKRDKKDKKKKKRSSRSSPHGREDTQREHMKRSRSSRSPSVGGEKGERHSKKKELKDENSAAKLMQEAADGLMLKVEKRVSKVSVASISSTAVDILLS